MTKIAQTPEPATKARAVTKIETLIAVLHKSGGADMATMIAATGWQAHSIRGAIAGAVRKRGHDVGSERVGETRVWRIVTPTEGAV